MICTKVGSDLIFVTMDVINSGLSVVTLEINCCNFLYRIVGVHDKRRGLTIKGYIIAVAC
jgi:hypothetical protein